MKVSLWITTKEKESEIRLTGHHGIEALMVFVEDVHVHPIESFLDIVSANREETLKSGSNVLEDRGFAQC